MWDKDPGPFLLPLLATAVATAMAHSCWSMPPLICEWSLGCWLQSSWHLGTLGSWLQSEKSSLLSEVLAASGHHSRAAWDGRCWRLAHWVAPPITQTAIPAPGCTEPYKVVGSGQIQENPRSAPSLSPTALLLSWAYCLNPPSLGWSLSQASGDSPQQFDLCHPALLSPYCSPDELVNIRTPFEDPVHRLLPGNFLAPRKIQNTNSWLEVGWERSILAPPTRPVLSQPGPGRDAVYSWLNLSSSNAFKEAMLWKAVRRSLALASWTSSRALALCEWKELGPWSLSKLYSSNNSATCSLWDPDKGSLRTLSHREMGKTRPGPWGCFEG